jgi:hypothetical protein
MRYFLVIFLFFNAIVWISAFENCGYEYQDKKLLNAHKYIMEKFPFEAINRIAQEYLPEALQVGRYVERFTNSLPANPKINRALEYICEKTHFDLLGWWRIFWAKFGKEFIFFIFEVSQKVLLPQLLTRQFPPHALTKMTL